MNGVIAESVVMDFVRSLGYDPAEVSEVVLTPLDVTVRGYRRAKGHVLVKDGQPIEWSETFQIERGTRA
jgi:hypothetical protein